VLTNKKDEKDLKNPTEITKICRDSRRFSQDLIDLQRFKEIFQDLIDLQRFRVIIEGFYRFS